MHTCSLDSNIEIAAGDLGDYEQLACYHYRADRPAGIKAIFTLRPRKPLGSLCRKAVGVIVYTMPLPCVDLRNLATNNLLKGFDRQTQLALINRNIRCLSRVIIEPRLRGIGLATRLVRETMPRMNVPIVEAVGVMPLVNPFLERAGMRVFMPRVRLEHVELVEALGLAGIEDNELIDPEAVQTKLDALSPSAAEFIEIRVRQFLKSHRSRRAMPPGVERTRYLLGKLTERPAYHVWFHPSLEVSLP
jgi:hypothetical protein